MEISYHDFINRDLFVIRRATSPTYIQPYLFGLENCNSPKHVCSRNLMSNHMYETGSEDAAPKAKHFSEHNKLHPRSCSEIIRTQSMALCPVNQFSPFHRTISYLSKMVLNVISGLPFNRSWYMKVSRYGGCGYLQTQWRPCLVPLSFPNNRFCIKSQMLSTSHDIASNFDDFNCPCHTFPANFTRLCQTFVYLVLVYEGIKIWRLRVFANTVTTMLGPAAVFQIIVFA